MCQEKDLSPTLHLALEMLQRATQSKPPESIQIKEDWFWDDEDIPDRILH